MPLLTRSCFSFPFLLISDTRENYSSRSYIDSIGATDVTGDKNCIQVANSSSPDTVWDINASRQNSTQIKPIGSPRPCYTTECTRNISIARRNQIMTKPPLASLPLTQTNTTTPIPRIVDASILQTQIHQHVPAEVKAMLSPRFLISEVRHLNKCHLRVWGAILDLCLGLDVVFMWEG